MLVLDNAVVSRGDTPLFAPISLSIFPGCALSIYGPNGAGKTSLLRCLAGLLPPQSGTIHYNDYNINKVLQDYTSIITYIGHYNALDSEFTVLDNLKFWSAIWNMEEAVTASLAVFSLEKYAYIPVHRLSQGLKKKVELTKLLLNQTAIWFLDEPFANLDPAGENMLLELIRVKCMNQGTVIFTSQTPYEADKMVMTNLSLIDYKRLII